VRERERERERDKEQGSKWESSRSGEERGEKLMSKGR